MNKQIKNLILKAGFPKFDEMNRGDLSQKLSWTKSGAGLSGVLFEPSERFALYKSPQKHAWVGLTDANIAQTMGETVEGSAMLPYLFARAIEAKIKEKNA